MTAADTTRLAGEAYRTRLACDDAATPDGETRLAQEGYQSKLARDVVGTRPEANELYTVGERIGGRYEVSAIHFGEFGVVYGCYDHETKLPRALKTIRARHARDRQVLSLFESEAAVWISLEKHPYIVRAYHVERFKSLPFVITAYVRGPADMEGDLRGWLGHSRLTLPVAVSMALQIAQGMQHTVRKVPNLVHRDLKPANILVNGDGKAMVTDFGLVHAARADSGTPAYMSPEQWRAEGLDARSDIYAYGCILFEMFTAHRLFPAFTEQDWENAHLEGKPAALNTLVSGIPSEIDQFVQCCLEKRPSARPQTWDGVVTFIAEWYHRLTGNAVILDFSSLSLDADEWLATSYSLLTLKRHQEALSACERALAIDPNNSAAWNNKGNALRNLKRSEEALQAYDRALAINPNYYSALNNKGLALGNLKRFDEAIQVYKLALAVEKNDARVWLNMAKAFGEHKRHEEAIQAVDQSLSIDPNYAAALYNKGVSLGELKRYEEAIQVYDRALAIEWNYADALTNKGHALYALVRYAEALQACNAALAIDPDNSTTWYNKGVVLVDLKRHEEAIQAFDRVITMNESDATVWNRKGGALGELKRYEESIQAYDRALAINPSYVAAWCNKGIAFGKLERYEEAVAVFGQALALNPTDANAWFKKGHALLKLGRFEEGLSAYDHASSLDSNGGVSFIRGFTLFKLKRYKESISACDRALAINPSLVSALNTKRAALQELKRQGET